MKYWEAIKSLEEGKKVRRSYWEEDSYIYTDSDNNLRDNYGALTNLCYIPGDDDDWEIYDERKEADDIIIELYNILSEIQKNYCSYDEFLDSSDVGYDNVDYTVKLYHQLQLMNSVYKLDVKSDCR